VTMSRAGDEGIAPVVAASLQQLAEQEGWYM
jgi:hypothetical protein